MNRTPLRLVIVGEVAYRIAAVIRWAGDVTGRILVGGKGWWL